MVCVAPPPQDVEEDVFELGGAGEEEGVQPVGGQVYYPGDSPAERLNNIVVQPGSSSKSWSQWVRFGWFNWFLP